MIYFLLPRLSHNTFNNIRYIVSNDPQIIVSNSLSHYLYDIKEHLNTYSYEWDIHKKYTNPYEYIHSIIQSKKKCIAKYKPLSRSFFKMIEISTCFNIHESKTPIQTFHLAEGPGGFIEAISYLRKCSDDKYTGMTILSDENDSNIPAWKKSFQFLKENPNVSIETGIDKTGNLLSFENFKYCQEKYKSSMDIITGDGGFDFSSDFKNQENNISNLLFAQIAYALVMQKHKGKFILKIFDSFMQHTIDLIAILSSFYEQVYITKPNTSRYANSEKYIVCIGFIHNSCDIFLPVLNNAFEKMTTILQPILDQCQDIQDGPTNIQNQPHIPIQSCRYLGITIPKLFLTKLEEYNSIFGQQQLENIHYTLSLIENRFKQDKIDTLIKQNSQKCIQWCIHHDMLYNNISENSNIFLNNVFKKSAFLPST